MLRSYNRPHSCFEPPKASDVRLILDLDGELFTGAIQDREVPVRSGETLWILAGPKNLDRCCADRI